MSTVQMASVIEAEIVDGFAQALPFCTVTKFKSCGARTELL